MDKKAEVFKAFVEEHDPKAFEMEQIPNDPHGTVIFRSHVVVDGQQLPVAILIDDTIYTMVRLQISPQCRSKENELAVLSFVNEENSKYKPFKLYFDQQGSLVLDNCLLTADSSNAYAHLGEQIYTMLSAFQSYLDDNYRTVMKKIW